MNVEKWSANDLGYGLVSVDDHVMEPAGLWVDRLSAAMREAAPRVVRELVVYRAGAPPLLGDVWHYEDARIPIVRSFGAAGLPLSEADDHPMTFDEMRPGCFEMTARLKDMDLDGVEASVCFPNVFVRFCGQRFNAGKDKTLALACVRAYNDWLAAEWCGPSEGRLFASGIIPLWDADLAAAEVLRNAEQGFRAVCFSEIPDRLGLPSMYSGYWEPFFSACADTETVINLHIGSSSQVHTTSPDAPPAVRISNHFGNSAFSLTDWLLCGAFMRHPSLKVAFSEGQAGWIPYLLSRLDGLWSSGSAIAGISDSLPEPPSTYFKDHVYSCVFDDQLAMQYIEMLGEDNVCFETDYPHPDGTFPNSLRAAIAQTATLDPVMQRRVLRLNGARLYRMDRVLRELAPELAGPWSG